jgi:hypothetical protein
VAGARAALGWWFLSQQFGVFADHGLTPAAFSMVSPSLGMDGCHGVGRCTPVMVVSLPLADCPDRDQQGWCPEVNSGSITRWRAGFAPGWLVSDATTPT